MFQNLVNSPLFRGMSAEEIDSLLLRIKHHVKHFRNGEMLAQAGEEVDKAMLLLDGRLQGEMVDFSGNSLKIEELDPPQMVAAAFLFGPKSTFPVFLSAKSEGKILILPKRDFTMMLTLEPRVMVNYLNIVSGKAQFLTGKITFLSPQNHQGKSGLLPDAKNEKWRKQHRQHKCFPNQPCRLVWCYPSFAVKNHT